MIPGTWIVRPTEPVPYDLASDLMHDLAERRADDLIPDVLILLEHPPVYTGGRRSDPAHMLWPEERMRARGAALRLADRGGSFTFHGPGQLVGYPIMRLDSRLDVIPHLRRMEEVAIRTGADLGLSLGRDERQTGVWAGPAKVCAIGVRLSAAKVTLHGFGLNCSTDLSWFDAIVPCGLPDRSVTSLSRVAGRTISVAEVAPLVERHAAEVFGSALVPAPTDIADAFAAPARAAER
ncbi:MAG: lipoyl(octanoyl) transferase LipB [Actinomycetota bacterium]